MKNKGFSLVELLVAISIAAVVAGSVGFLLTTSLRMFGNETTEVSQQQELQTSLNMIMDYAMESQSLVISNSGTQTEYLALGTIDSSDSSKLNSEVFFVDNRNLYMCKIPISDYEKVQDVTPRNLDDRVKKIKEDALDDSANLAQYLLAENVTSFYVQADGAKKEGENRYYTNPLSIEVSLEFTKKGFSKEIQKKVSDRAVFRNSINSKIYLDHLDYGVKRDALSIKTETVEMDKNSAKIQIPGTKVVPKSNLNILEIVPDYSYDYVQFVVGGYNGKINNVEHITYGSSATYDPISDTELEGYILQTCGATDSYKGNTNSNNVSLISGFFPNIGVDIKSMIQTPQAERNGYYEYVGAENGGIYAIDSYEVAGSVALNPGTGESKPIVLGYTRTYNSWGGSDDKNWTGKVFNPVFEYCPYEESGRDYYRAVPISSGRNDYELVTEERDGSTTSYYKYVGDGNGTTSLDFTKNYYRNKQSYDKYNGFCYAVSSSYDAVDEENGEYYACISGWESRDISGGASYEWGYDFNQKINRAVMYSKYFNHPQSSKAESHDFGWIWKEAEQGTELYNGIDNGQYFTAVGALSDGLKLAGEDYARGTMLYLKNHYRYGLVNNDLFKLFVMQDTLEQYVDGSKKMLDISNGRYDETNNRFCEINDAAIKKWEAAGNYIKLDVRIPSDLTDADIENCDMIIVGTSTDGGFAFANKWFNAIRNTSVSKEFSQTNDITFKQATEIYKKVCDETVAIACPYNLKSAGAAAGTLNISKMYYMTYCVSNWDFVSSSEGKMTVIDDTVKNSIEKKKTEQGDENYWTINPSYMSDVQNNVMIKGCGRDFFKDFLISMSGEELSKSLYDDGTLTHKTTEFVYIDENGRIVVPAKNTTINEGGKSYSFNYGASTITSFGAGGGNSFTDFEGNFLQRNHNDYLMDRYRAYISGIYQKRTFVFNSKYHLKENVVDRENPQEEDYCGHYYKFYYDDASNGIYRNMLLYNQESDLFKFNMSGSFGILHLKTINQNAAQYVKVSDPKDVGVFELVGYAVGKDVAKAGGNRDNGRYNLPSNHESMTHDECMEAGMYYQHEFEELGENKGKIAYISDEELEQAKVDDNGLFVYFLIKSKTNLYSESEMDKNNPNNPYLHYTNGLGGKGVSEIYPEWAGEAIRYGKEGDTYVTEFRAHIPDSYFTDFTAPVNGGNNVITAQVGTVGIWTNFPKTDIMFGSEEFYICVRDTLDLD